MTTFYDGDQPLWQDHKDYAWNEYKHLERDKFEELLDMMIAAYPDHELTEWMKRGFCMNDGDSTIAFKSLSGTQTLNHHLNIWDEEDDEFYDEWFGDEEEIEFDDDW